MPFICGVSHCRRNLRSAKSLHQLFTALGASGGTAPKVWGIGSRSQDRDSHHQPMILHIRAFSFVLRQSPKTEQVQMTTPAVVVFVNGRCSFTGLAPVSPQFGSAALRPVTQNTLTLIPAPFGQLVSRDLRLTESWHTCV